MATEPRVTRFKINWDDAETNRQPIEEPEEGVVMANAAVGFSENSQSAMEVM